MWLVWVEARLWNSTVTHPRCYITVSAEHHSVGMLLSEHNMLLMQYKNVLSNQTGICAHAGRQSRDRVFLFDKVGNCLWHDGIMWFRCIGCHKLWYSKVNGSSTHVLKLSWHCHLIWSGVNPPWTSLHYASSVVEVSGKQVALAFSHSCSEAGFWTRSWTACSLLGKLLPSHFISKWK